MGNSLEIPKRCIDFATKNPKYEPTNSEGAKLPPLPPLPSVNPVANDFSKTVIPINASKIHSLFL